MCGTSHDDADNRPSAEGTSLGIEERHARRYALTLYILRPHGLQDSRQLPYDPAII